MPDPAKILVADTPDAIPLHEEIWGERYQVVTVNDFAAACGQASGDVDVVVCGVHFDESRMLEFFSTIRRVPKPFVCFRGLETPIASAALRVTKLACEVLGTAGFIDFVKLREKNGHDRATEMSRECLEQALRGKKVECD